MPALQEIYSIPFHGGILSREQAEYDNYTYNYSAAS